VNTYSPFLDKYRDALICLLLAVAVLLAYGQTGSHEFIDWDDDHYVTKNHWVQQGLTLKSVNWAFTATHSSNWHPLTWLSHMLDYELHGLDAGGHHLTSVFLHLASSLLLFYLLRRMSGMTWGSAFVAACFALHPLHVESVAWVAERKDVLSAFFGMLALYAYALYTERPGLVRYMLVFLLFGFGLMAKPMLVTLPFVLLLLDYWPLRRLELRSLGVMGDTLRRRSVFHLILEKVPLLALSAASSVITMYAQERGGAVTALKGEPVHGDGAAVSFYIGLGERFANAAVSYVSYLGKMIAPYDLSFFYPFREVIPDWQVYAAVGFLLVTSLAALLLVRRFPYLFVGWFWYLGMLVPVIGVVQVGWQAMADRYTYLPLIGIFIVIAGAFGDLLKVWPRAVRAVAVVASALIVVMAGLAWKQTGYWKDGITLYGRAVAVAPEDSFGHFKLGVALADRGEFDGAIERFRQAIRLQPYDMRSRFNLGLALFKQGKVDAAISQYTEALEIYPAFDMARQQLKIALAFKRSLEDKAVLGGPEATHMARGFELERQGKFEQAVQEYRKILALDPRHLQAHQHLGTVLHRLGQMDKAIVHYKEVLQASPNLAGAHYNLGLALVGQGKVEEAVNHYVEALRLKPDFVEVHNNLGVALSRLGRPEEAVSHFRQALQLRPDYPQARDNLNKIMALQQSANQSR
jgi:tetratricopeptide (TPR) repeat protein